MAVRYLLDTNICVYIAKQHPIKVLEKFKHLMVEEVGMSIITYGELLYGAYKSHHVEKNVTLLKELERSIPVLPIPPETGKYYGQIRQQLEKSGKPIGNNDLWIAAHALCIDVTLISNNLKEFSRISSLKLENWV